MTHVFPYQGTMVDRKPTIVVAFDQKIIPSEVLSVITCVSETPGVGKQKHKLVLSDYVNPSQDPANDSQWPKAQSICFNSETEFPFNSKITITVGPKIKSQEGPLLSADKYSYSFDFQIVPDFIVVDQPELNSDSITLNFSQILPSIDKITKKQLPKIEPQPKNYEFGVWVVMDNDKKKLRFKCAPGNVLDRSTAFVVTIPKSFQSFYGHSLTEKNTPVLTVSTDTTTVKYICPDPETFVSSEPVVIAVAFSQAINIAETLKVTRVKFSNGTIAQIVKGTTTDIQLDVMKRFVERCEKSIAGSVMLIKIVHLPTNAGSKLDLTIGPKVVSAEGPLM